MQTLSLRQSVLLFTLRLTLFSALFCGLCSLIASHFLRSSWIGRIGFPSEDVYSAVALAEKTLPSSTKFVVIGDSVANQLYPAGIHEHVVSFASNQAIELPGMLALLETSIISQPKDQPYPAVVLVIVPGIFEKNLDQPYTYHYFIKIFGRHPFRERLPPAVIDWINAWPASRWAGFPLVRLSAWSPNTEPPDGTGKNFAFAALHRMASLCQEHNIHFRMICPPAREDLRDSIELLARSWPRDPPLDRLFQDYLDTLRFLPNSLFRDKVHYVDPSALGSNPLQL